MKPIFSNCSTAFRSTPERLRIEIYIILSSSFVWGYAPSGTVLCFVESTGTMLSAL